MTPLLTALLAQRLGSPITVARRLSGGDINDAFALELADGSEVFVKTRADAPPDMFAAEARGLDWLREAAALRVPEVLCVARPEDPPFLVLEFLRAAPHGRDFDERLGQGLAALHRFGAPSFGLDHDNFIGNLRQSNRGKTSWPDFFRDERLLPQVKLAHTAGLLDGRDLRRFDALYARLSDLVGPAELAQRLHGDLWGGNLHVDERGAPCLIDPAVYGGHREMDLAMMRLFGGFPRRVFDAYREAYPLASGHEERVPLYQLYPLLVHVNLFGAAYVGQVRGALALCG